MLPLVALPQTTADEFSQSIRPVLAQNCAACHNPGNPKNRINFLKATTAKDIEANRGLWRDVADATAQPHHAAGGYQTDRRRPAASGALDRQPSAADRLLCGRFRGRGGDPAPEPPRISQHHPRSAGRRLQRRRTVPRRWHRRRRLRHQRRNALRPAAADGALSGSGAADSGPRHRHARSVEDFTPPNCCRRSRIDGLRELAPGQDLSAAGFGLRGRRLRRPVSGRTQGRHGHAGR